MSEHPVTFIKQKFSTIKKPAHAYIGKALTMRTVHEGEFIIIAPSADVAEKVFNKLSDSSHIMDVLKVQDVAVIDGSLINPCEE